MNLKFVLTSEHFAQERARLDALEKQLKAERAKLDEFEQDAVRLAASFEPVGSDRLAKTTMRRKALITPRASASEHNRPYTPAQIETLRTASRADLAQLATDWGRTPDGLEKKREEIRAIARREATVAEPAPEKPVSEPYTVRYEDSENVENASGHEWNSRSIRSSLRPGKPVRRIIDNGPDDRRFLDPVAFSSKNLI